MVRPLFGLESVWCEGEGIDVDNKLEGVAFADGGGAGCRADVPEDDVDAVALEEVPDVGDGRWLARERVAKDGLGGRTLISSQTAQPYQRYWVVRVSSIDLTQQKVSNWEVLALYQRTSNKPPVEVV